MKLSRLIMRFQRRLPSWCVPSPSNLSLVLVFALAYVTVRAYLLKMIRQQRAIVYQLEPSDVIYQEVRRIFPHPKTETSHSRKDCPLLSLSQRSAAQVELSTGELQEAFLYGSCRRVPPLPGSCDVANQIFFSSPPELCSAQNSFNFCQLVGSADVGWKVVCNETTAKACLSQFFVSIMNQTSGRMEWIELGSLSRLSSMLNTMIHKTSSNFNHFGFVFIKCMIEKAPTPKVNEEEEELFNEDIFGEQLLILPPNFARTGHLETGNFRKVININLVFIDSVSHQHFFRSLNASVTMLEQIQASPHPVASVFDFELVQAVKSRTFESLQAIFTGSIDTDTEPFGTQDLPPEPLKLEVLLAGFKQHKYRTLWLEDLCYTWEWGLPKDLHFLQENEVDDKEFWDQMWLKLYEAEVDDVGPTLAMCRVLKANHVRDQFHGPKAVCFNGRHQHEYLLDYLLLYQQTAMAAQQPIFTFTQTNVAHEDSGRRIQTLDQALASYIDSVSHLSNTLTIVLSDHGNSYGAFMKNSQEAKRELYHPAMFFIIPNRVGRILGEDIMHALKINTKRLVGFHDLHKTLLYLQNPNRKSRIALNPSHLGLFSPVDANRTCNDVPRIKPSLCICKDFETSVVNDTEYNLLAYFAIGRLNDEIQRQSLRALFQPADGSSKRLSMVAFNNCEKLILRGVENIKKSMEKDGSLTIKMELLVQMSQVFFVSLVLKPQPVQRSDNQESQLKLQTYERLTSYSQYTPCAEADKVWTSLCVCNQRNLNPSSGSDKYHDLPMKNDHMDRHTVNRNEKPYFVTFDIDLSCVGGSYKNVKEDVEFVQKNASKQLIYNGRIFLIPQHQDYVSEKLLPGYKISTCFLKSRLDKNDSKTMQLENLEKCLLLVWVKHPKGVVLSIANTCQDHFSLFLMASVGKEKKMNEASSLLYTALPSSDADKLVLMPRGIQLLAVLWGKGIESFRSTSVQLKLRVRFTNPH